MIKINHFIRASPSRIVLIISFILLPFLFSRRAKSPGGAAGTGYGTSHATTTLMTGSTPKAGSRQS